MRVIGFDPEITLDEACAAALPGLEAPWPRVDELLQARAHYITLHTPLVPATKAPDGCRRGSPIDAGRAAVLLNFAREAHRQRGSGGLTGLNENRLACRIVCDFPSPTCCASP
jgi:phosphoglycerate dehydrogenase-like enzyme